MPMTVAGMACFGAFGCGVRALGDGFRHAMRPDGNGCGAASANTAAAGRDNLVTQADTAALAAYFPARALRQVDRFSRMALLGSCLALEDAGLPAAAPEHCGVVLASGYGPATPTFDFLDSLLDFGEGMASPLAFSHSVNNIPAAIVAKTLGVAGPCATVCQFESPVAAGLLLARAWLEEGRVERVLFGALDEATPVLARTVERFAAEGTGAGTRESGAGTPSAAPMFPVADGAVFFLLSCTSGGGRGRIASVEMAVPGNGAGGPAWPAAARAAGEPPCEADAERGTLVFHSGNAFFHKDRNGALPAGGSRAGRAVPDGRRVYGSIPVAQAFDCAAALALLAGTGGRGQCLELGRDAASRVTLVGTGA